MYVGNTLLLLLCVFRAAGKLEMLLLKKKERGYNNDCSTVLSSVCLFSISAGLANWFYVTLAVLLMYIQYNNSAKTLQEAADLFLFAFKE